MLTKCLYPERQEKLISSLERYSLISTASKWLLVSNPTPNSEKLKQKLLVSKRRNCSEITEWLMKNLRRGFLYTT